LECESLLSPELDSGLLLLLGTVSNRSLHISETNPRLKMSRAGVSQYKAVASYRTPKNHDINVVLQIINPVYPLNPVYPVKYFIQSEKQLPTDNRLGV